MNVMKKQATLHEKSFKTLKNNVDMKNNQCYNKYNETNKKLRGS